MSVIRFLARRTAGGAPARLRGGVGGAAAGAARAGRLRVGVRAGPRGASPPNGTASASIVRSRQQYARLAAAHRSRWISANRSSTGSPVVGLVLAERAPTPRSSRRRRSIVATLIGIPGGVITGSRRGGAGRGCCAARRWCCSRCRRSSARWCCSPSRRAPAGCRSRAWAGRAISILPTLALALPIAATLERLQSQSIAEALRAPVGAGGARARCPDCARGLAPRLAPVARAGARRSTA